MENPLNLPQLFEFPDALKRGRQGKDFDLQADYARDIEDSDLLMIFTTEVGSTTRPLVRISQAHHAAARLLADGHKQVDVARITGYSQSRLSIMKNDPAFGELIAHYKGVKEIAYADVHEQLANVSSTALGIIQERLEDRPEEFTVTDLKDVAKLTLDRSGHGPTKTIKTLNAGDVIKALKENIDAQKTGKVLPKELAV